VYHNLLEIKIIKIKTAIHQLLIYAIIEALMDKPSLLFTKTKKLPIDIRFFFLFLLTFTLSVRKVLFYFPIEGTFNEYTGIYIYISDIFLILAITSWIISILCNTKPLLSMFNLWITTQIHKLSSRLALELKFLFPKYKPTPSSQKPSSVSLLFHKMFHACLPTRQVEQGSYSKSETSSDTKLISNLPFTTSNYQATISKSHVSRVKYETKRGTLKNAVSRMAPLLLLIWGFLSIIWSDNRAIALFRSVKMAEFYLLYLFVAARIVPRGTSTSKRGAEGDDTNCSTWNNSALIIIFVASVQSIIAILQIFFQHSIGLHWLRESLIAPNIPGVAKVLLHGETYIRTYGLFPHPNVLGGFLLFSIIFTLWYSKLFHVEQLEARGDSKLFQWLHISISIQALALIFSLSKSAVLGLFIAILYLLYAAKSSSHYQEEELRVRWKLFHVEQFLRIDSLTFKKLHILKNKPKLLLALIIIMGLFILKPNVNSLLFKSLTERQFYLNVSRGTILNNPILGEGIGQFVLSIPIYTSQAIESWQFQPVHNIFLLIWSELGIIGLSLFSWFLWRLFKKPKTEIGECCILENKSNILSSWSLSKYPKAILLGLIFIMLFDHYLWDIQQGSLMLWMTVGFIAGLSRK